MKLAALPSSPPTAIDIHRYIFSALNGPAEQAIRAVALGRKNWLHIGGDGGLPRGAVLLSLAASCKRHHVAPWEYVKDLLTQIPARPKGADLSDLLPDAWARSTNPRNPAPAPPESPHVRSAYAYSKIERYSTTKPDLMACQPMAWAR